MATTAASSGFHSDASSPRERKASVVEMGPGGRRVSMADLNGEDQELAQKFGYKPVYTHPFP